MRSDERKVISKQIVANELLEEMMTAAKISLFPKLFVLGISILVFSLCLTSKNLLGYAIGALVLIATLVLFFLLEFELWFRIYPAIKHQRFSIQEDELLQIIPQEFHGFRRYRGRAHPIYRDTFHFAHHDHFFADDDQMKLCSVGDRFFVLIYDHNPKKIVRIYNQKFYRLEK